MAKAKKSKAQDTQQSGDQNISTDFNMQQTTPNHTPPVQANAGPAAAVSESTTLKKPGKAKANKNDAGKGAQLAKPAPSVPMIDTSHAVSAAAAMVAGGASHAQANQPSTKESAAFKQMKEGLHKPAVGGGMGKLLDKSGSGKKSNAGFNQFGKQVGRNQTFGADVNRTGVPRRTGG